MSGVSRFSFARTQLKNRIKAPEMHKRGALNVTMEIRQYRPEDKIALRRVCSVTAPAFSTDKEKDALYAAYLDYYLDCESEYCFVAANDDGVPIGYVICAHDYGEYARRYFSRELPYSTKLLKSAPKVWLSKKAEAALTKKVAAEYPAHLHIDILPEGQRMGIGTALIDKLKEKLASSGIGGVYLVCSAKNEKGVNFYRKYGFKEVKKLPGSIVFGLKTGV